MKIITALALAAICVLHVEGAAFHSPPNSTRPSPASSRRGSAGDQTNVTKKSGTPEHIWIPEPKQSPRKSTCSSTGRRPKWNLPTPSELRRRHKEFKTKQKKLAAEEKKLAAEDKVSLLAQRIRDGYRQETLDEKKDRDISKLQEEQRKYSECFLTVLRKTYAAFARDIRTCKSPCPNPKCHAVWYQYASFIKPGKTEIRFEIPFPKSVPAHKRDRNLGNTKLTDWKPKPVRDWETSPHHKYGRVVSKYFDPSDLKGMEEYTSKCQMCVKWSH